MILQQLERNEATRKLLAYELSKNQGVIKGVHSFIEEWVYNFVAGGTYRNPYLGDLRLPNIPLTKEVQEKYDLTHMLNRTRKVNKYLKYQESRLNRALKEENAPKYFAILKLLMTKSVGFKMYFLNKSCKGWYFNKPIGYIFKVFCRLRYLPKKDYVKTTRFYIEKASGKLRPIGSPAKEWNAYLSMLSWGLTKWTKNHLKDQHGFLPGRGLWSAWNDFLTTVRKSENILEFDYSKCFNSIPLWNTVRGLNVFKGWKENLTGWSGTISGFGNIMTFDQAQRSKISLERALHFHKIPKELILRILKMNQSYPKLMSKDAKLDTEDPELWHQVYDKKIISSLSVMPTIHEDGKLKVRTEGEYIIINNNKHLSNEKFGLTQGSPLSPILCNIFLDYWERKTPHPDLKSLKYADDGFFYSGNKINVEELLANKEGATKGIKFNRDKTKLVKEEGKWLTEEVKFLGAKFNPILETLEGHKIKDIDPKKLFLIVGKTYNIMDVEPWSWEVDKLSMIAQIFDHQGDIIKPINEIRNTGLKPHELSTICMTMVLQSLHDRRKVRKTSSRNIALATI